MRNILGEVMNQTCPKCGSKFPITGELPNPSCPNCHEKLFDPWQCSSCPCREQLVANTNKKAFERVINYIGSDYAYFGMEKAGQEWVQRTLTAQEKQYKKLLGIVLDILQDYTKSGLH